MLGRRMCSFTATELAAVKPPIFLTSQTSQLQLCAASAPWLNLSQREAWISDPALSYKFMSAPHLHRRERGPDQRRRRPVRHHVQRDAPRRRA